MGASLIPHFVIVGAVKAATTWTAVHLARRPDIFVPNPEPRFFSENYDKGLEWYLALFSSAPAGAIVGEKSADYLAHPTALARMSKAIPAAKIIVQLRDPVDRAYSDYRMLYRRGTTRHPPEAYFSRRSPPNDIGSRFLRGGLYFEHLRRCFDHFAREQVLVLLYEDIRDEPQRTFDMAADHIGADRIKLEAIGVARENDSSSPLLPIAMRRALSPLKQAVAPWRGKSWFEALRGVFAKEIDYPALDAEARAFLRDYYLEDVMNLGALIRRDLSGWLRPERTEAVASADAINSAARGLV